ncbi:MAG: PP2C family protein-serine/threonine phosphatase, partial [Candidatus Aquicultor sp.]
NRMQDEILAAQAKQLALQGEIQQRNKELSGLYERQKNLASILQENLLPVIARKVDHLEIGLKFQSATEAALVGGDFFDFFEIAEQRFGIVIGDVSGKGIEAATLASRIRNTIRAFAYDEPSPAKVVGRVNNIAVIETIPTLFVTLIYGMLDVNTHRLLYANAGHWPPLVFSAKTDEISELKTGGLPIGAFGNAKYEDYATELEAGTITVLYTDGVIEARKDDELFGTERLGHIVKEYASVSADDLANTIIEKAKSFGGGKLNDDAAVMVIKLLE